jgi:hypothetical protein
MGAYQQFLIIDFLLFISAVIRSCKSFPSVSLQILKTTKQWDWGAHPLNFRAQMSF